MYLSHYGLKKKPFGISPDPSFLWLGEKHREALAYLKYGIMENKGFLMITGDVGTGKTALIKCLTRQIDAATFVVSVPDPDMDRLDFFNFIADELGMDRIFKSKGEFLIHFKRFLQQAYSEHRKVLLIVDESQRLNHDLLQEIRLLSSIDLGGQVLLNIFFVGQTEFNQMLKEERNRTVRQRIAASFHIDPLEADEVTNYIIHRLRVAGAGKQIFTDEALQRVFEYTAGYPRLINILCDHALMTGYATGATAILPSMVDECAGELTVTFGNRMPASVPKVEREPDLPPAPASDSVSTAGVIMMEKVRQMAIAAAQSKKSFLQPLALGFAGLLMLVGVTYFAYVPVRDFVATRSQTETELPPLSRFKPEGANAISTSEAATVGGQSSAAAAKQVQTEIPAAFRTAGADGAILSQLPENAESSQVIAGVAKSTIIFFDYNSYDLPRNAAAELIRLVGALFRYPKTELSVVGYTDSRGDERSNRELSQSRADIVRDFLVQHGISPGQIKAIGNGSDDPVADNRTLRGRQRNRRVEIEIRFPTGSQFGPG